MMQAIKCHQTDDRTVNLLGALALALADALRAGVEGASHQGFTGSAALATVAAFPGEPLDNLGRILKLSAAGTSRLVDRLVAAGLMVRQTTGADGRSRAVNLTRAGAKRADRMLAARRSALQCALAPLSPGDRDALGRLLEIMLRALTPDRETCDHTCRLCDMTACPEEICPVEVAALRAEG